MSERELYIKRILEEATNYQGAYRFNTLDISTKLDISFTTLWNTLYNLQCEGELGFEAKDEGMYLEIEQIPESFSSLLDYLCKSNLRNIDINFKKVRVSA